MALPREGNGEEPATRGHMSMQVYLVGLCQGMTQRSYPIFLQDYNRSDLESWLFAGKLGLRGTGGTSIWLNFSSSESPCFSQKAGPMPRTSISSSVLRRRLRKIS